MDNPKIQRRGAFIVNLVFFILVAALFYFSVKYVLGWLMPFIIGFVISLALRPVISWVVDRLKLGRKLAAVVIVLIGYAVFGTVFTLLTIELVSLLGRLFSNLPDFFTNSIMPALSNLGNSFDNLLDRMPEEWVEMIKLAQTSITSALMNGVTEISKVGLNSLAEIAKGIPGFLIALVFTILSSFFISQNYYGVTHFIAAQLPPRATKVIVAGKAAIASTVGAYVRAYAKIMLVTFVELTIGFLIIGIANPLPLAFGIAIFDILPVFGTGGVLIPWILIDLLLGEYSQALGLLIIYGVITVVRNFIEPKIVGDQLGLNPVVSIIAIYLGYRWFGVLGMIMMPVSVALAITLHNKGVITLYKRPAPVDEEAERKRREQRRQERAQARRKAREARKKNGGAFFSKKRPPDSSSK